MDTYLFVKVTDQVAVQLVYEHLYGLISLH